MLHELVSEDLLPSNIPSAVSFTAEQGHFHKKDRGLSYCKIIISILVNFVTKTKSSLTKALTASTTPSLPPLLSLTESLKAETAETAMIKIYHVLQQNVPLLKSLCGGTRILSVKKHLNDCTVAPQIKILETMHHQQIANHQHMANMLSWARGKEENRPVGSKVTAIPKRTTQVWHIKRFYPEYTVFCIHILEK